MAEYIERAGVIAEFHRLGLGENSLVEKIFADGVYAVLETFPAADVGPVRHGQWIEDSDGDGRYCSECGQDYCYLVSDAENYHYCPNCGAKMDGEADGDD